MRPKKIYTLKRTPLKVKTASLKRSPLKAKVSSLKKTAIKKQNDKYREDWKP